MSSDNYKNIKAGIWNGWCHSHVQQIEVYVRLFPQCFPSFLGIEIQQNNPSLGQDISLAPLAKYLHLGLISDALLSFVM